ncbi:hypothetical protein PHYBLDRAFT_102328, partial [Phycomyces blakesleeanus NRRL 1555(-)]
NLPRLERYKKENVVLIGLMPGPKEAKTSEINHYLCPLVAELNQLYGGVVMPTIQCPSGALVRSVLLPIACDIPATCKNCGFTSHSSTCACNKCNQQFPCLSDSNAADYSAFVLSEWVPRTDAKNCCDVKLWRMASSDAQRKRLERENGVRWSELHDLVYFNLVECTVINPIHNLYL